MQDMIECLPPTFYEKVLLLINAHTFKLAIFSAPLCYFYSYSQKGTWTDIIAKKEFTYSFIFKSLR